MRNGTACCDENPVGDCERFAKRGPVDATHTLEMGPLRPDRHTYHFRDADAVVDYAIEHDMPVRAHTLAWHNQTPEWVPELSDDPLLFDGSNDPKTAYDAVKEALAEY